MSGPARLSDLLWSRVIDEQGSTLGHVREVLARDVDGQLRVDSLAVGRRGFAERLGFRQRSPGRDRVAWADVVRTDGRKTVVRTGARPR